MLKFVIVCLTGHSVPKHTWVLMGPDLHKMLKLGKKCNYHAGWEYKEKPNELSLRNERNIVILDTLCIFRIASTNLILN